MQERQEAILREIVESYIKTFEPVPSKALVEKFNCSSATIRNDMSSLEEMGLLEKEHTSSGRIPSEKGYKYYVDHLMKPKDITGEDVLKLQTILNNNNLVISDAVEKCMEIISYITHYTTGSLNEWGPPVPTMQMSTKKPASWRACFLDYLINYIAFISKFDITFVSGKPSGVARK